MFQLSEETRDDWWEVEALYDLCFAPGREALSSYRLRDDVAPIGPLCLIARDETGAVGAAIRYWPVQICGKDGEVWRALLLGPIAVHPTRQGEGLAALVIQESLERAIKIGWERVMLVGDAPYYGRFGFSELRGVRMPPPTNPARVLGYGIEGGAWDGVRGKVQRDVSNAA